MKNQKEIKKMETREEIQMLERYIADFWQCLPIPVCYVNSLNIIINVDANFENFSGYKSDEIAGVDLEKLFANQRKIKEIEEEILNIGSISNQEAIFITKEKRKIPVLLSAISRKEEGNTTGYFLSIMDIAERKQAAEELKHSEQQYRSTIDYIGKAIHVVDKNLNIVLFNKTFKQWNKELGFETEYLIGRNIFDIFPFLPDAVRDEYQKVFKTGKMLITVETNELAGKVITTETRKIPILENNKVVRVVTVIDDITERKRTEEALRESEKKYKTLFESTLDGVFVLDAETMKVVLANQSAMKIYGFNSVEEVVGVNPLDFISPEDKDRVLKIIAKDMFENDLRQINEFQTITKDGREIWISAVGAGTEYQGRLAGLISIRDITKRKQAEQVQSVLYNIAEAVNTTKDLDELYQLIHKQLGKVIDTTNFYIAIYDRENDNILFPYHIDKKDEFTSHPARKTLTFYVMRTGKPLFANEEVMERLIQSGETGRAKPRTSAKIWLGVPLKKGKEIFGVIAVQSYTDASLYTEKDLEILEFVSKEIALAIERKRAEEALRESEERFRSIVEHSHDGIVIVDDAYRLLYVNDELCRTFGYSREEIIGQNFRKFLDEESKQLLADRYIRRQRGEMVPPRYESNIMRKDGEKRRVEISSTVTKDSAGKVKTLAQILDITERKLAEEALRTSEAQLSNAMMIARLGYWEYDVDDDLFTFNDHFYDIFRTTAEKVGGYKMSPEQYTKQFIHPDDISVVGNETRKAIETTDPNFSRQLEHRIIYADGEIGYISVRFFIVKDSHGRTIKTYGANQDITERKKMEGELKDSEIRYHNLFENSSELLFTLDLKGNFTDVNKAAETLSGYTKSELLKMNFKDYTPKRDHRKLLITFSNIYKTGKPLHDLPIEVIIKDGSIKYFETSFSLLKKGEQIIGYQGSSKDITERKLAEEALRESEERYRIVFERAGDYVLMLDVEQGEIPIIMDANKAALVTHGYSRDEIIGMPITFFDKEMTPEMFLERKQLIETKGGGILFCYHTRKDGTGFAVEVNIQLIQIGEKRVLLSIERDITERKQAEQVQSVLYNIAEAVNTTRDLDELYQLIHIQLGTILDTTNFYVALYDEKSNIIYVALYDEKSNIITVPYYVDQLKKNIPQPQQLKNGLTAYVIHTAKHLYLTVEKREKLMKEGKIAQADWKSKIWIGLPLKTKNKVIGAMAVQSYTDASLYNEKDLDIIEFVSEQIAIAIERKRMEESLKKSEEKYRKQFEEALDAILIADAETGILIDCNRAALELVGRKKSELVGKHQRILHPPEEIKGKLGRTFKQHLKEKEGQTLETRVITKKGEIKEVAIKANILELENKKVLQGIFRDITERKQAEIIQQTLYNISNALNTTKDLSDLYSKIRDFLGNVIDTTNFFVALYDEKTYMISLPFHVDKKDKFETFPAGKTLAKYVISTGKALFATNDVVGDLTKKGIVETIGTPSEIWLGVPLKVENKVIGVIAVQSYDDPNLYTEKDIEILTFISEEISLAIEHKQTDEQIRRGLKEKELLLREIHHRVKNNLQVISSLLQLQQNEITTKEDAIKGFAASQDRILAMSKAYELLLGSEYMSEVSVGKYIESLAEQLKYNYDIHHKVKISYSLDELTMSIKILDRLGLVLNEIITNAIKYAFEGRDKGNIHIELKETEKHVVIKISDDGIGMLENIDINDPDTLGLSIVDMITQQLQGTLSLDRKNGTSFTLNIPIE